MGGGICSDNSNKTYIVHYLHCPHRLPLNSLPTPLKATARDFLVLFHLVYEVHLPYTVTFLPSPSPYYYLPPPYTVPILQSWFSLLTFKLMFKGGVSKYAHCGCAFLWLVLYFG
jgi:hypothetical protein